MKAACGRHRDVLAPDEHRWRQWHGAKARLAGPLSAAETKALIVRAVERLQAEVPALGQLKLVAKLELRARGGDAPIWRVEVPGPEVSKDPAGDARLQVSVARSHFNELARDGTLRHWADAYERGHVKVSGDSAVMKLLGNVIERRLSAVGGGARHS
jgi:hypothetical protein